MKRALLGLAIAAAASIATPPASAAPYCGDTFQPPCEYCLYEWTDIPQCVSIDLGPAGG